MHQGQTETGRPWNKGILPSIAIIFGAIFVNLAAVMVCETAVFVLLKEQIAQDSTRVVGALAQAGSYLTGGLLTIAYFRWVYGSPPRLDVTTAGNRRVGGAVFRTIAWAIGGFLAVRFLDQIYLSIMLPHVQSITGNFPGEDSLSAAAMVSLATAIVLAPLVEETIFRGFIYNMLRQSLTCKGAAVPVATIVATLLSAACFTLVHPLNGMFVQHFIFGVIAAEVYRRSGNLLAPILMHCMFNISVAALMFMGVLL